MNEEVKINARLVPYEEGFCHEFCRICHHCETSISDVLTDKIPRWTAWIPILIWAATGFGKTHFVLHHLVPHVLATGGRLLLVSNRLAASVQQKRELMRVLKHPLEGGLTDTGLRKFEDFGPVKIMTLQRLQNFINDEEGKKWCKGVTHLVVDEAHYFTSDFSFNPWTGTLLHQIPQIFCYAVRIYMTATPEDVLYPLTRAEDKASLPIDERFRRFFGYTYPSRAKHLEVHQFSTCYDHIRLKYFRSSDELIQAIQTAPTQEKWLVFITSIKSGEALQTKLAEKIGGKDVCFVTADDKASPQWSKIVNEEQLPCRVVLTTSVLDCGTNIVDDSLRNVVIFSTFRTEFMQALGRKRCRNGQDFTLYVPVPNPQHLALLRSRINKQLSFVRNVENATIEENLKLRQELWISGDQDLKAVSWISEHGFLQLNLVAVHAVKQQNRQLEQLEKMDTSFGDSAFPRLVHGWLQQEDSYDESCWLGADKVAECRITLLEYLKDHCNKILPEDEKNHLQDMILALLKLETNKGNRKDRPKLQHGALNNRLEELHIPFWIENDKGSWIIRRCRPTSTGDEEEL